MKIKFKLNGDLVETNIRPDAFLIDVLRDLDCLGVKKAVTQALAVLVQSI